MFKSILRQAAIAIALSAAISASVVPFAVAQTASSSERGDSQSTRRSAAVPYLIQYLGQSQILGIRCVHSSRSSRAERLTFSEPTMRVIERDSSTPVMIAVPRECDEVWIRLQPIDASALSWQDASSSDRILDELLHNSRFHERSRDSDWLTREGSGWYWLLHH